MDWVTSVQPEGSQRVYFLISHMNQASALGGYNSLSVGTEVYLVFHAAEHGLGSWDASQSKG